MAAATLSALIAFWFSEPMIESGDIDAKDPLRLPFDIHNTHYLPLRILDTKCIVNARYAKYSTDNQQLAYAAGMHAVTLSYAEHSPYLCRFFTQAGFEEIAVHVVVRYHILALPLWIWKREADFRIIPSPDGSLHWIRGFDPANVDPPTFIEYEAPTERGFVYLYCDRDWGVEGGDCTVSGVPYDLTVVSGDVRKIGNKAHMALRLKIRGPGAADR